MNTQSIPPSDPLVATMPLGRDVHSSKPFVPSCLDDDTLARMRAPPDVDELGDDSGESSDDEGEKAQGDLPGAFPGSSSTTSNGESYY